MTLTYARAGYGGRGQKHLKYKTDSISLTLTAGNRSHKVKKRYQINICRFRFDETMLVGIKFNVMQNMIMYN
jgi:hypothetical protein